MAQRVTKAGLYVSVAMDGALRASKQSLIISGGFDAPIRVTKHALIISGGIDAAIRATYHGMYAIGSPHALFILNRLESNSEIYGFGDTPWLIETSESIIPEHNPYRPRIPEAMIDLGDDFYNFYEENQNILRQQHNITQAGDTTFPYQLMLKTHSDKQYTLGSLSRFYHEQWGLIHARYVQFDLMAQTTSANVPVGLINNKPQHEWVVTNRFDLSHPDLVVGMTPQLSRPVDGEYGWVIVDGPILQEVQNESATAEIGETFAWNSTGAVSNTAAGRVLGRRINKVEEDEIRLPAGTLYICLEGFSLESIRIFIDEVTADFQAALETLQELIDDISAVTLDSSFFTNLQASLVLIQNSLNTEIRARKNADVNLNSRISNLNFVTSGQLNTAVTNLTNVIEAYKIYVDNRFDNLVLDDGGAVVDLTPLWDQITLILGLIAQVQAAPKNKFPVANGAVPPELVYMDDGSLVYVES
jgi:hypothetical protein